MLTMLINIYIFDTFYYICKYIRDQNDSFVNILETKMVYFVNAKHIATAGQQRSTEKEEHPTDKLKYLQKQLVFNWNKYII